MDLKTFKTDLTYSCKKFAKEGKILTVHDGNLVIDNEGKFVAEGSELEALEMFVLVKGYVPTAEMMTIYHDKWVDPQGVTHESHIPHHTMYNLSMVDVIVEQAQIAREDIYSFMNGFENVEAETKNEFHTVGVYIREKFLPVGAREKTLTKVEYKSNVSAGKVERKFTIYSRKGKTAIMEVEVEMISPPGTTEYVGRILAPTLFHQKVEKKRADGTKQVTLVPDVWVWHAFQDTIEDAKAKLESTVRDGFAFEIRKGRRTEFTEEEVQSEMAKAEVIML
jgi:hypothetical protein